MARFAGLDLDPTTLRMAIFEGTSKKYALVDFIEEEIAAESVEERQEVIRDILSDVLAKKENRGMEIVSSLDSRKVILREISVPYLKDDAIQKTIRFEAESYLHAHAIEDVIIEYLKCGETEDSSRLILCAVIKRHIAEHLEELQTAGVDPSVVELDATALATCFASTPLHSGEQNVLLVELQPHYSRLVFLEKEHLVKIRSVWSRTEALQRPDRLLESRSSDDPAAKPMESGGGEKGTEIERRFEDIERSLLEIDRVDEGESPLDEIPVAVITDEEYERLTSLDEPTAPPQKTLTPAPAHPLGSVAGDAVDRLILEIERTFAAYVLTNPIDLVVVTGACAVDLNAAERLADHFEVDVVPFDVGDSFPIDWQGDPSVLNTRGAVACGLGLRALGHGLTQLDLRREEFRFERRFERLMPSLTLLGFLVCFVTLLWSVGVYNRSLLVKTEIQVLQHTQRQWFETFFDESPSEGRPVLAEAQERFRPKQRRTGVKKVKQYLPSMEILNDITNSIQNVKPPRVYPEYHLLDFKLAKDKKSALKMKLVLNDPGEVTRIKDSLRSNSKYIGEIVDSWKASKEGGEVSFDMRLKPNVYKE